MSLITDNTQIRLISELAPAGGLVSDDLLFLERGSVNYNQTYSGLVAGLVDDVTTNLVGNKIQVKDNGIKTAKIQNNAVSLLKIQNIDSLTAIANITGASTSPSAVVIDTDLTSVSANHDTLVTAKAVKGYIDNIPPSSPELDLTGLVDDVTTGLTGSNKIEVKNNAITTNKIIDNNVTLGKLATVSNDRVLGNTTGGGTVNQITIDQTLSNSADNIASSSAIKNYIVNIPFAVKRLKSGSSVGLDSGYIGTGIDVTSPNYAESSFALRGTFSWEIYSDPSSQPILHDMGNIFIKKDAGEEPYIVIVGAITNTPLVSGALLSHGETVVAAPYYYNYNNTPYYYNYNRRHVSNELCFSISIADTPFGDYIFGTLLEGAMHYRGNIISPGEGTKF